jgi:hypothetical protein
MWLLTLRGNRARKSLFSSIVGGLFYRFGWVSSVFLFQRAPVSPFRLRPRVGLPPKRSSRGRREGEGGRGGPFCRA